MDYKLIQKGLEKLPTTANAEAKQRTEVERIAKQIVQQHRDGI